MRSRNFGIPAALLAILASSTVLSAQARLKNNLLNKALDQSLQERAIFQEIYKGNKAKPQQIETEDELQAMQPIAIEMGDEIGSGASSDQGSARIGRSEERMIREDISSFDKELRDANRALGGTRAGEKQGR